MEKRLTTELAVEGLSSPADQRTVEKVGRKLKKRLTGFIEQKCRSLIILQYIWVIGHRLILLSVRDTTSSTGMGAGRNGNN